MRSEIVAREVLVRGRRARVFIGGAGPAVLLVHGGWGGAEVHWARVWDALAASTTVIAPDLPGLGAPIAGEVALASVADYARWLVELLDQLAVPSACAVGNSFGASVAWRLRVSSPARCGGLVIVDGVAMPPTPRWLLPLGHTRLGLALLRALVRRIAYAPGSLPRAFADPRRAPRAMVDMLGSGAPPQLAAYARCLVAGDGPPPPPPSVLVVWGARDRLPGTAVRTARRLAAQLPAAELTILEDAGHFPQVEQPERFAARVAAFVHAVAPARGRGLG